MKCPGHRRLRPDRACYSRGRATAPAATARCSASLERLGGAGLLAPPRFFFGGSSLSEPDHSEPESSLPPSLSEADHSLSELLPSEAAMGEGDSLSDELMPPKTFFFVYSRHGTGAHWH